jgi:hypothetical protein
VLRINVWPVGDRLSGAPSKSAPGARAPLAPPKGRPWISLNVICVIPVSASSTGQFYWATVTNRDMQSSRNLETTKVSNPSNFESSRILQNPTINLHLQTPVTRLLSFRLCKSIYFPFLTIVPIICHTLPFISFL